MEHPFKLLSFVVLLLLLLGGRRRIIESINHICTSYWNQWNMMILYIALLYIVQIQRRMVPLHLWSCRSGFMEDGVTSYKLCTIVYALDATTNGGNLKTFCGYAAISR